MVVGSCPPYREEQLVLVEKISMAIAAHHGRIHGVKMAAYARNRITHNKNVIFQNGNERKDRALRKINSL